MSDFRETLYTIDSHGARRWVYPAEIRGYFRKRRNIIAAILLIIYSLMPWITIDGLQAVHLDIYRRKFIFFGQVFWATDSSFLLLTLLSLAISLFFFTSIFGRIWCGWACPQTVFLEFVFRPIEALIEGNASARRRLDQSAWDLSKLRIKLTKYFLFALVAWFLASTVLAYFVGREDLLAMMSDYPWNNPSTFFITLALMAVLLFQFGWFREQFCTILCPYARFQSVLLDDSSLLVGYDSKRGEKRGKLSDSEAGDCIDCGLCVRVCPTGIDIRNGLQLECIQCAQCADACDSIMSKVGRPTGLIRYDTERGLDGNKTRFLRPRVLIYATILMLIFSVFAFMLYSRELSEAQLLHSTRSSLYSQLNDGRIENHLELHLANKDDSVRMFTVEVKGRKDVELVVPLSPYPLAASTVSNLPVFAHFEPELLINGKLHVEVEVRDDAGFKKTLAIELIGPG